MEYRKMKNVPLFVVKISLKTLLQKQEIAFKSTLNPRASRALRQELNPGHIRATFRSPSRTSYAQSVDE